MKYLFLNHKMHLTFEEIGAYKRDFEKLSWDFLEVAVFPSFVYLPCFMEQSYLVASQDVSSFDLGAHTGEIGAKQLKELQVKYSLVGHSERRK